MGHLPFRRALEWLYIEERDQNYLRAQFDELTLPLPDSEALEDISERAASLPISPLARKRLGLKRYDENDHKIFAKLGYEEIYLKSVGREDKALWGEVQRLLRNPVCRVAVDVGVLCKYTASDLLQLIPVTFQEILSEEGLELYQKYFFDTAPMARSDWRAYLKLCNEIPYAYVRYHAALTKPKKEALYLAGVATKPAFSDFLKTVMATAEYKFDYYSRHNNQMSDAQARAWAKVGFDAGVRLDKFSAKDATDFSKSVQTSFVYEETEIEDASSDLLSQVKVSNEIEEKTKAPTPPQLTPDLEP